METKGLDEILNNDTDEPIVEPKSEIHETTGVADDVRPRGPDGKFLPKDTGDKPQEPQAAAPAAEGVSPAPDPAPVPESALLGERRRRQEAERRLQHMEAQLQQFQRQPQANEPVPDFWENPDGALDARLSSFGQTLIQQFEQRQIEQAANRAERAAAAKYPDYFEYRDAFVSAVQSNPALAAEWREADDPAEFAYRRGKAARTLADVGDLDTYKTQVIEEYKASLLAGTPLAPTIPMTTADDRSVSGRDLPTFTGPPPLGDILKS